jgi:hypothetical protein
VKFAHEPEELPFTARPDDVEAHGKAIYWGCVSEQYGPVQEAPGFVPPPPAFQPPRRSLTIPGWPDFFTALDDANRENDNGTERGTVLVWTSIIDDILRNSLTLFFADAGDNVIRKLLDPSRPLGSFSSRIDLAFALGIIDSTEHRLCHSMRDIRNSFAHGVGVSLEEESFQQRCVNLYEQLVDGNSKRPPRLLFGTAGFRMAIILAHRAHLASKRRCELLQESLPVSQRPEV